MKQLLNRIAMRYDTDSTICAAATPIGEGAISIIRLSGQKALEAVDSLVKFKHGTAAETKGYELKYGEIEGLDEVMVSLFRAPNSYTGEDSAEISCHASAYIVSEILHRLCDFGCRLAQGGEFTRRAFMNGKMDLSQAEAVADIIAADSKLSHDFALSQLKGSYSKEFKALRAELVRLCSLLELELDFSEEEVNFADREQLAQLLDSCIGKVSSLKSSFRLGNAVKRGVPVSIVGAPNSGKSTLLNALVGDERAIVSDIPGTTRDTIEETIVIDGVRYRFIDTAGLRESDDVVEKIGICRSLSSLRSSLIVLALLDAQEDVAALREILRQIQAETTDSQGLIPIINKCELVSAERIEEMREMIGEVCGKTACSLMNRECIGDETKETTMAACIKTACGRSDRECIGEETKETTGADQLDRHVITDMASHTSLCGASVTEKCTLLDAESNDVNVSTGSTNNDIGLVKNTAWQSSIVKISALEGDGLDALKDRINEVRKSLLGDENGVVVTSERHYEALSNALRELQLARESLQQGLSGELLAEDLRSASDSLSSILGEITTHELLGEIFSKFCIGK